MGPGWGFRRASRMPMYVLTLEHPAFAGSRAGARAIGGLVSRDKTSTVQRQADRRTTALLGLVILVLLGFAFTIPALWVSVVKSGFLGDNIPAGGWMLLVGLVGLTVLFCLYILHQQGEI